MKQTLLLAPVILLICEDASRAQEVREPSDTPLEVLQFLEQAVGSWYATVGGARCACTVNSRANGRCVVLEGRQFGTAISFSSMFGWYSPSRQVIGMVVFENGESLLVRAFVRQESAQLSASGTVVGILGGQPVKATYHAKCGERVWSVEFLADSGKAIKGSIQRTGSR